MHAFSILFISVIFASCRGLPRYGAEDVDADDNVDAYYKLPKNGELFEGDIVMDDMLRRAVWGQQSKKSALKTTESILWPGGKVHYEIDEKFPPENREMLIAAMKEFHLRTCIRFIPRNKTNAKAYIYYSAEKDECSSSIGMRGERQVINLGKHCMVLGTFEHENMHALGFIHEHSRPDRDLYIKVLFENIDAKERNNFEKYTVGEVNNLHSRFNFASILLYRNDAFTKNGKKTIEALEDTTLKFGQREKFSVGDVREINNLYNCTREQKDPNYHGLFREYFLKSRKKKDLEKRRILDYLRKIQRRLHSDEREKYSDEGGIY